MPTVAVLGLGEAGSRLAGDLAEAGAEVRAYDPAGREVDGVARASETEAAVAGADVVLSLTSAAAALGAAAAALPALAHGSIYADLNTAAPELKREIAALVGAAGARFADVALIGAVPATGLAHAGARLRGRRPGVRRRASARSGCRSRWSPSRPGDAATLKLLRSVFMKGIAAAAIESLQAAEAAGQREWLEQRDRGCARRAAAPPPARGQPQARGAAGRRDGGGARPAARARDRASDRDGERGPARRPGGRSASGER